MFGKPSISDIEDKISNKKRKLEKHQKLYTNTLRGLIGLSKKKIKGGNINRKEKRGLKKYIKILKNLVKYEEKLRKSAEKVGSEVSKLRDEVKKKNELGVTEQTVTVDVKKNINDLERFVKLKRKIKEERKLRIKIEKDLRLRKVKKYKKKIKKLEEEQEKVRGFAEDITSLLDSRAKA